MLMLANDLLFLRFASDVVHSLDSVIRLGVRGVYTSMDVQRAFVISNRYRFFARRCVAT